MQAQVLVSAALLCMSLKSPAQVLLSNLTKIVIQVLSTENTFSAYYCSKEQSPLLFAGCYVRSLVVVLVEKVHAAFWSQKLGVNKWVMLWIGAVTFVKGKKKTLGQLFLVHSSS